MNLTAEVISLIVGLLTTFVVPYLNKRFGMHLNPTQVGTVATDVLDEAAKKLPQLPPIPPSAYPPGANGPQPIYPPTLPPASNPEVTEIPVPPMSRPLDLSAIPPNENGAK